MKIKDLDDVFAATVLACGLVFASFVLGGKFKNFRDSGVLTVKGLAEVEHKADYAVWQLGVSVWGDTYGKTVEKVKSEYATLLKTLAEQGVSEESIDVNNFSINKHYETRRRLDGEYESVHQGYDATQLLTINTKDLAKVQELLNFMHELKAQNDAIVINDPSYLISNLDELKRSLISKATEDAKARAEETLKSSDSEVGKIKRASQGAFYIYDQNGERSDDYSGAYQTNKINKTARLVVTIDFAIE